MNETYEYKFVRLEQQTEWFTSYDTFRSDSACQSYQDVVHEHTRQGWRLVQILRQEYPCTERQRILN